MALESNKKELILGLNNFDKPADAIGKDAWVRLILYLMFLKKGSYPTLPDMGVDIRGYEYQFMDDALDSLPSEIMEQVRLYLPDIPLETVTVDTVEVEGKTILLVILEFMDNMIDDTVVIATTLSQNIIDFEISM